MRHFSLALLVLAFGAERVCAQELDAATQSLVYRVPSECPDRASFVGEVKARTPEARLTHPSSGSRNQPAKNQPGLAFRVSAERGAPGWEAVLLVESGGQESQRRVPGATCAEAVSGLALVTALIIDPTARTGEVTPVEPPPEAEPKAEPEPEPQRTSRPAKESPLLWRLGVHAQVDVLSAPRLGWGGSFSAELRSKTSRGAWRAHASARLGGTATGVFPTRLDARASFIHPAVSLASCPLGWSGERGGLWACAAAVGGVVLAEGHDLDNPKRAMTPFFGVGPGAMASWQVGATWFQLTVEAPFSLVETRFFFEPDRDLYFTPLVTPRIHLGVAWDL